MPSKSTVLLLATAALLVLSANQASGWTNAQVSSCLDSRSKSALVEACAKSTLITDNGKTENKKFLQCVSRSNSLMDGATAQNVVQCLNKQKTF